MENPTIHAYLLNAYTRLAYTDNYIFGYVVKGMVYAARVNAADSILPYITTLDRASTKNGGTISLKYKPNAAHIAVITAAAEEVRPICSVEYMETLRAAATGNNKNRGYLFEVLCADAFGGELNDKPNAKFTNGGDMEVNGVPYQVKFPKATFTDERTIKNLMKAE